MASLASSMALTFSGFLDGADCANDGSNCYVAIPSTVPPAVNFIFSLDGWAGRALRNLLMMIPWTWTPPPEHCGGVVEIRPGVGMLRRASCGCSRTPRARTWRCNTGVLLMKGRSIWDHCTTTSLGWWPSTSDCGPA